MRKRLLILFFMLNIFSALTHAKSIDLSKIDKTIIDQAKLKFHFLDKKEFTRFEIEQFLKWLVEENHFDTALYESEDNSHYNIKVSRVRKIESISILGHHSISETRLIREFGIYENSKFDQESILDGAERLRQLYRESGFLNAVIDVETSPSTKNNVKVRILIKENQMTRLSSIRIDTNNADLRNRFEKIAADNIGNPFTPTNLKILQAEYFQYLKDNHYYKAEISDPTISLSKDQAQAHITFKIEHPEKYRIDFPTIPGHVSFQTIRDAIGLAEYTTTSPNVAQDIALKIKAFYLSLGYSRAVIETQEEEGMEPFLMIIKLTLNEGPRVKIEKIEFSGSSSKSSRTYEEILLSQTTVMNDGFFVKDELDKALKNLIIDRRNNGYFKAKILSTRTVFNQERDAVSILINMDEGPLTLVESINFEGNLQTSTADLLKELNLKPNEPLKLNELESGIQKIKKLYQDSGFLEMNLRNEKNENDDMVSYNQDNTQAQIRLKIFEGPKVIVGSIAIEGNTITKDYVILKEIEFKQNDILTPALIEESKNRLQRVGIFGSVDIRTLEEKTMISRRTVLIRVIDRDPGIFNSGLGFTNELDFTLRGYGGLAYRNISGMARVASGRIDMNYNVPHIKFLERKASVGYLHPYLFDSRVKSRINYTVADYVSDFSVLKGTILQQGTLSLEQEVTSHFLFRWDVLNLGSYEDFLIRSNGTLNRVIIGSTGPTIEIDYRDNPFNPTKGTFTRLSAEWGSPEFASDSNIRYGRTLGSFSHNLNFFRRFVWANQIRGGYIQNFADTAIGGYVPWTQKGFILGGQSTIRGFTAGDAFPNANDLGNNFKMTTNSTMYLVKSELRFPIRGNIGGVVFYDGGAVNIDSVNLNYTYRHSAGFGVRYITPVGPVSGEIGWKLNPLSIRGESPFALHLSIGTF